ncbi:hypothetical protein F7725_011460 [Dissostichus mawsoni]|uniref:HSR domain-containing protein n=1 Tax=Dissostichus mawsoni TaxID=36200 RepID=A0A7J5ZB29_DISMA|nr:hypothetical protein F7725_011460 [Dissostichus mawsoni]
MSRVEAFRDTNLRSMLRGLRTDIAMAVDDPFPLVYGLVDKNIITDQLLKDTLEKEGSEGIHKAMYSLLSWVLEQSRSTIQAFWSNLSKDYNLDSYPKLQTLLTNLHSKWDAAGARGEKKLSTTQKHLTSRRGATRTERQTHTICNLSIMPRQAMDQRPVTLSSSSSLAELPVSHEATEKIHIQQIQCIQVGEQFYPEQTNGASQAAENMFHHQGETHTGMVEILSAFTHSHVFPLKLLLCPNGTWQCDWCRGNTVKRENAHLPLQPLIAQTQQTITSSSNSIMDVSFFSLLSSSALTAVAAPTNELSGMSQCSGGELLRVREVCSVCNREGGELTHCLQCSQHFHTHCLSSKGRSICSSCSGPWGGSAGREAESSRVLQLAPGVHDQSPPVPEPGLHKDELDSSWETGPLIASCSGLSTTSLGPSPTPKGASSDRQTTCSHVGNLTGEVMP